MKFAAGGVEPLLFGIHRIDNPEFSIHLRTSETNSGI